MTTLHDIQKALLHDIYTGEQASSVYLAHNRYGSINRLSIYRNNTRIALTEVLSGIYPTVQKIVGEDFFQAMSGLYIKKAPQTTGNRNKFGESLANFITEFHPASAMPYLADIAKIEWAYFQAAIADDSTSLDFKSITEKTSAPKSFTLDLHPSVDFVYTKFNALEIWQEHQKEDIGTIKFLEKPQAILIWRNRKEHLMLKEISNALSIFIKSCKEGLDFASAMSLAVEETNNTALLQQDFAHAVTLGVFSNTMLIKKERKRP